MTVVGVDVTAHKEALDAADARRKPRVRARYYVELLVGSRHADHTRLGFSGTFQALLALHQAFARAYRDKHSGGSGSGNGSDGSGSDGLSAEQAHRRRESASSTSSTASQSSASSASSSTMRRLLQSLGHRRRGSDAGSRSSLDRPYRASVGASDAPPGLPPFPAPHKLLVRLEGDGSQDDAKVEARAAALFDYYAQLFNAEDGALYVELVQQRALQAAERKRQQQQRQQSPENDAPETSGGLFKQLRSRHNRDGDAPDHVEFLEPVHVRKPRAHKSAKRSSAAATGSNQRAH